MTLMMNYHSKEQVMKLKTKFKNIRERSGEAEKFLSIAIDKSNKLLINASVSNDLNEDSDAVALIFAAMTESERFRKIVFSAMEYHYKYATLSD